MVIVHLVKAEYICKNCRLKALQVEKGVIRQKCF